MKVRLFDAGENLRGYLPRMKARSLNFTRTDRFPERELTAEIRAQVADLPQLDLSFLYEYHIFPPEILRFRGEWEEDGREMREGDTIVQQALVPPGPVGLKLIFGVRILDVWRERDRAGFRYGTLEGHPERGLNEFSFSKDGECITARISTCAGTGTAISHLVARVFTFPFARHCNRRALEQMVGLFLRRNGMQAVAVSFNFETGKKRGEI